MRHHLDEEESELFPALRKSGLDLAALGERIMNRKNELEAKLLKDVGDRT